ncbi:hypothetical protein F4859DRAFT_529026 [Xylaria cf. heliscus]|nr:hypothetical protein F4859DRAFT_529026 [Xylaria cf. heliscus]
MSDERVLANGELASPVDAQSHEEPPNYEEGPTDTQDLLRHSESETTTTTTATTTHHHDDVVAQEPPARTSGEGLNGDPTSPNPTTHDEARSPTPVAINGGIQDIRQDYFTAIREQNHELIHDLLAAQTVTPETTNYEGQTPLLAAVESGHIETTRLLLSAGADANAYGVAGRAPGKRGRAGAQIFRTPLQLAAAKGNLPTVKLLMEDYGADDALVAPDGELALRLASAAGHRDVVAYLPARRGGGFRRWKGRHAVAMRRAARAGKALYEAGRFFVWTLPKHAVVLPVVRWLRWLHAHHAELVSIVTDALKKLPGRVWRFLKWIPPLVKELGEILRDTAVATVKGIPKAAKTVASWVWNGVVVFVGVVWWGVDRLFSFLHTAAVAVGTFFKSATLRNVWDGFVAFLHAVFVEGPGRVWVWMRKFGGVAVDGLIAMWGWVGEALGWVFRGLVKAVTYVPRKLWEILVSMARSIGYGGEEVMIWFNPKR